MDAQEIATAKANALALLAVPTMKAMTPAEFISWGMDEVAKAEAAASPVVHKSILDVLEKAIGIAKAEFAETIAKGGLPTANIPITATVDTASTTIDPAGSGAPAMPKPPEQVQTVPVAKGAGDAAPAQVHDLSARIAARRAELDKSK